jgi:putative NADH-flavin reductase
MTMKITIFGATGGIGQQLLEQAIAADHDVTAVVRDPARLSTQVRSLRANLASVDPAVLISAVSGADAVLSGLGRRSPADAGISIRGTQAIMQAMSLAGVSRLVVISAAPVATLPSPARPNPPRDPGEGFLMRNLLSPLIKVAFRDSYAELARMEDAVLISELDWTVVRPPRLIDKPLTGRYRTAIDQNVRRGVSISRADVADCMLATLDRPETIQHAVGVAY